MSDHVEQPEDEEQQRRIQEDADLLHRMRNRDEEAWSRFVARHTPYLFVVIHNAGIPNQDIPDVLATVWMKVCEKLDTLQADRLIGWLATVARHKSLDYHRIAKTRSKLSTNYIPIEKLEAPAPKTDDSGEKLALIARALLLLSDRDREILQFVHFNEERDDPKGRYKKYAAAHGVSPETAASRLHNAKKRLIEVIHRLEAEDRGASPER